MTERSDIVIDLCRDRLSEEELINRVVKVDAILVGTTLISQRIIDAARLLKVVSRRGVGYDNVDLPALRRRNIPLTIVGSAIAGLDVFKKEPLPSNHPFVGLENVILSPHAASLTRECAQRMDEVAARNCLDGIDGTLDPAVIVPNEGS